MDRPAAHGWSTRWALWLLTSLLACGLLVSACGKKGKGVEEAPGPAPLSAGPRQGLAQFSSQFSTELTNFDIDVRHLLADGALGSMIQRDTYDAVARLTRERAEQLHLDLLCIVNPEGKTWLRASNPIDRGGTELYDTTGECEAGMCVDLRALILRAVNQPNSCKPSVEVIPPELLRHENLFTFRVDDLLRNGIPREDLAGRRLDRAIRVPLLARGAAASEPRALMMLDVVPISTSRGERIGVLVAGWLVSRTSTLPDSFRLSQKSDASIFLERTRVSSTVTLEDQSPVVGSQLSEDVWEQVCTAGEFSTGRLDLGYGPVDAAFERLTDGTGRHIGALMVEQPSLPEATDIEFVKAAPPAAAKGGEGGGEAKGGEAKAEGGEGGGGEGAKAEGGGE
jgi:hypothetical protein